ncbi:uncharacterized protein LOC142351976 [Convolutriloba macropyga]|uniref:uncharacterized protein LOC142351976 n=1 Tax=Convolutriloba macropyga TaxID=536237 RepID=UPI003F5286A6
MSVDQFSRGGVENNTHNSVAKSAHEIASRGYSGGKTATTLTRILIIVIIVVVTVNQFFIFSMWMEKPDEPSMLSLNTEDADHSELVDGDMNTCHYATSAGLDGGLFINVDDGTAYIHYVDIFLPTTATPGDVIEIFACVDYSCYSNCENIEVPVEELNESNRWTRSYCSSPGNYILVEQRYGYLKMCEVYIYGKLLR